jgi:hypothetical protein
MRRTPRRTTATRVKRLDAEQSRASKDGRTSGFRLKLELVERPNLARSRHQSNFRLESKPKFLWVPAAAFASGQV